METVLTSQDKSLVANVSINHNQETVPIRQAKENVVLTFDQVRTLYNDCNYYNQIPNDKF